MLTGDGGCLTTNTWISSDYVGKEVNLKFSTQDPLKKVNVIDLMDVLVKGNEYQKFFMMKRCYEYSSFQSSRSCLNKNKKTRLPHSCGGLLGVKRNLNFWH